MKATEKFVGWFEINTRDRATALKFYQEVFGWKYEDMEMGEAGVYKLMSSNDKMFGGSMELAGPEMEGVPPHWAVYFNVTNLDETLEKFKANGGELLFGPMPIPGDGRIFGGKDNQGAYFCVVDENQDELEGHSDAVSWVENMTPDRAKSVDFYTKVLDWKSIDEEMGDPVGTYSMFGKGDQFYAGCMTIPDPNIPPNWTVYLASANAQATCDSIIKNGGQVVQPPMSIGQYGTIAMAMDPTGAMFGIHESSHQ